MARHPFLPPPGSRLPDEVRQRLEVDPRLADALARFDAATVRTREAEAVLQARQRRQRKPAAKHKASPASLKAYLKRRVAEAKAEGDLLYYATEKAACEQLWVVPRAMFRQSWKINVEKAVRGKGRPPKSLFAD
jgi:hypothetical protein